MGQYRYLVKVNRIVDGDTLDLEFDLGLDVFAKRRVRLFGIDTPETFGVKRGSEEYRAGMLAKKYVRDFLSGQKCIVAETHKDKTGKYGRYLADIYVGDSFDAATESLNDSLVKNGMARPVSY